MVGTSAPGRFRNAAAAAAAALLVVGLGGTAQAEVPAADLPSVAPMAIPPATGNNAVISVRVGGVRTAPSAVSGIPGVQLGFYNNPTGGTAQFTCTSDADGDCSIVVPSTQPGGGNRDQQFWVRPMSTPAGWFTNNNLGTGETVASAPYRFQTGTQLRAGQTYTSQTSFMLATGNTNNQASGGIWQNSLNNPTFPAQCGINVGIVHDLSNSLSAGDLTAMKAASSAFVDALTGTPSAVSAFTFATAAPAAGTANATLPLTGVATVAGANSVKSAINGFALPGGNDGGTNWDRGIQQVADATTSFDVVVVITDGNPTFYGPNAEGPGSRTRFREVESGIFSANAVKDTGSRLIAFGVGSGVGSAASGLNLRAISGPVSSSDYYQTTDYAQAAAQLRALALGNCEGTISVVKQVIPNTNAPGSTDGAQPAPGWFFNASTTAPGLTLEDPTRRQTDQTGGTNFPITFADPSTTGPVTITEEPQDGYSLEQIDGQNAVCTNTATQQPVPSQNVDDGFTVTADPGTSISCIVYNRSPAVPATVQLDKRWNIDGLVYAEGFQPAGFVATGSIDGNADVPWGVPQPGFRVGDTVELDETVDLAGRPGCELTSATLTSANGAPVDVNLPAAQTLDEVANVFTITNVVECESRLSLVKSVRFGDAEPTDWTLMAFEPGGTEPLFQGPTGTPAVTNVTIQPNVRYALAEDDPDPRYVQFVGPNAVIEPPSTGTWGCQQIGPDGEVIPGFADGLNGGVTVPVGFDVRCTALNQTAEITMIKEVRNEFGGTAVPEDFTLTATPGESPEVPGLEEVSVTGSIEGEKIVIRPDHRYLLRETEIPDGYTLEQVECVILEEVRSVSTIELPPGAEAVCTFVNVDQPAQLTLRKQVDPGDTGATDVPADWTLTAAPDGIDGQDPVSGNGEDGVTGEEVFAGTYDLTEAGPEGYEAGEWVCEGDGGTLDGSSVTLANGADVTCTIVNTAQQSTLTLVKEVVNDHDGTAEATDWELSATGPTLGIVGPTGSGSVTDVPVVAGSYGLAESGGPDGYDASDWVCETPDGPLTVVASAVTIGLGQDVTCTITNDDQPASLTLVKEVVNDDGGTAEATDWTLTADGPTPISGATGDDAVTDAEVSAGDYTLSEEGPDGYDASDWICTGGELDDATVTVANGADVTCTITNDDQAASLTLVKEVDPGETGAEDPATDWTLTADGPATISGATGDPAVTGAEVSAGDYTLSEEGPDGYDASDWVCEGAEADGDTVTVPNGGDVTCTITNTAQQPMLTLVKEVVNEHGGTAEATDWTLSADGPTTGITGPTGDTAVTSVPVAVGDYTLTEADGPAGYSAGPWECDAGSLEGDTLTVGLGQDITCTITNEDVPAALTLVKEVTNDHGGTAEDTDWTLSADGPTPFSGVTGSVDVTDVPVTPGDYTLSESDEPGYAPSDEGWVCVGPEGALPVDDASVTVALGQSVVCTITNDDQPARLTLVKDPQVGDTGATDVAADWTLTADPQDIEGQSTVSGNGDPTTPGGVNAVDVSAGDYALSESAEPGGYDASAWVCEGADVTADGVVTVPLDTDVTCTITNTAQQSTLTLVKVVEGGDADVTDWTLSATGPTTGIEGPTGDPVVIEQPVQVGDYELAETGGPDGYEASEWDCTAGTLSGASLTVGLGQDITCTITNTFAPPPDATWTVFKESDPPSGSEVAPGDVITYTVRAGVVSGDAVDDVVVVDDLSSVLNNATFVDGSIDAGAGTASVSGTTLTWDIGTLSETVVLTYQVQVDDDAIGVTLRNVVTGEGAEPCPPDGPELPARFAVAQAADDCRTTTHRTPGDEPTPTPTPTPTPGPTPGPGPVPTPPDGDLPGTGGPAGWIAATGLLLLVSGAWLLALRRRRLTARGE